MKALSGWASFPYLYGGQNRPADAGYFSRGNGWNHHADDSGNLHAWHFDGHAPMTCHGLALGAKYCQVAEPQVSSLTRDQYSHAPLSFSTIALLHYSVRGQGLSFRGNNESYDSSNQGNFLELLRFLVNHNEDYNAVAFKNALDNVKFSSLEIQKDIVSAVSNETVSVIIRDLGGSLFDIMIDDSRDISRKKQMAIVLHYVNKNGLVEHFLAIVVNIINVLSKRCNIRRDKQVYKVIEVLSSGELSSGKDLNQETNMQRANDTCWGSHYGTLMSITLMFSSIIDVLEIVAKDESNSEQRFHAKNILKLMQSLDFVFTQFLMKGIIGFTTELSQTLQRKDDIVNTMILVEACKQALQLMRDSGWETLLSKVCSFCANHDINVSNMDD
ncbi:uncharacterized protein LOC116108418 [Pistacia vera]|uniref:uncharacterized protein LOC116108418 n=1 Tax=Pistacia vera TaxID=55513 RepID=UPI0012638690|nr:uncharacterized protein LOC116108418 [Pistacia vera]